MRFLLRTLIWLFVGVAPAISAAAEPLSRSVLIVSQWEPIRDASPRLIEIKIGSRFLA